MKKSIRASNEWWYYPNEVCRVLGVKRTTIYSYMKKGLHYRTRKTSNCREISGMEIKRFWLYRGDNPFLCHQHNTKYYCIFNHIKKPYTQPIAEKITNCSQLILRLAK